MLPEQEIRALLDASSPVLDQVHPELALRVRTLIILLGHNDLPYAAFAGNRSWPQQDALYAQGRTRPGKIVTRARGGESEHNYGLAVDLAEDGDLTREGMQWSWAKLTDYLKIGSFAKMVGLEWGGLWKSFKDYPHVQLTCGLTIPNLQELHARGGLPQVWAHVNSLLPDTING